MSEPFVGQIMMVGFNFAPRGWAFCDGQMLPISQNQALFSLLGTTYGGDGRTTFALPDLRGRVAIHQGSGPGLTTRRIGEKAGAERVTLTASTMPVHGHSAQGQMKMKATNSDAQTDEPAGKVLAKATRGDVYGDPANLTDMASQSVSVTVDDNAGAGQPHENMQPYQVVNFIIALQGLYPSRQ
jgi:microcystin-dependent protein